MAPGVSCMEVRLNLPDEVVLLLDSGDVPGEILKRLAVTLYAEGKVSFGAAAHLARVPYADFFQVLASYGVCLNYTEEDLAEDLRTLKELDAHDGRC